MSNGIPTTVRERFQRLLMGAVDNELTPNEHEEFQEMVETYPEFRNEWQEFNQISNKELKKFIEENKDLFFN